MPTYIQVLWSSTQTNTQVQSSDKLAANNPDNEDLIKKRSDRAFCMALSERLSGSPQGIPNL